MATHHDVAWNWAKQTGCSRNGKRMFYEDATIYSHGRHWPLGRLGEIHGERFALMCSDSRTRSVSTYTHYRIACAAASRAGLKVIEVPSEQKENVKQMLETIREHIAKADRARIHKIWPEREAREVLGHLTEYVRLFEIEPYAAIFQTHDVAHLNPRSVLAMLTMHDAVKEAA